MSAGININGKKRPALHTKRWMFKETGLHFTILEIHYLNPHEDSTCCEYALKKARKCFMNE